MNTVLTGDPHPGDQPTFNQPAPGAAPAAGAAAPNAAMNDAPKDESGVFGLWAPGEEVAKLAYFGLYALQHRGQESAGIATSNGEKILVYKDMGLVSQVFDDPSLRALTGHIAVGHTRYAMNGPATWENAQPTLGPTAGGTIALGHNGRLTNAPELRRLAKDLGRTIQEGGRDASDAAHMVALFEGQEGDSLFDTAARMLPRFEGAYSIVFMDEHTLYAARDPYGVRPLVLGRLERGWAVASETAALDIIGASFVREIEPGELIAIDENGVRTANFAAPTPKGCVFEYVYLARPDTTIAGRSVNSSRVLMGRKLAQEHPAEADLVIPVPESGTPAAIGYATESGIPFAQGLTKNSYVGRTFIEPSQTIRQLGIRLKLNPLKEVIRGQRLVVVDDSIVRGNTQRALVRMLREAGAAEVHVRISSPPVKWPCFYGIDFATRAELVANSLTVDQVGASLGADSLGYISIEGMIEATTLPESRLCTACFSGNYPIPLGENDSPSTSTSPVLGAPADGLSTLSVGRGGEGALKHP